MPPVYSQSNPYALAGTQPSAPSTTQTNPAIGMFGGYNPISWQWQQPAQSAPSNSTYAKPPSGGYAGIESKPGAYGGGQSPSWGFALADGGVVPSVPQGSYGSSTDINSALGTIMDAYEYGQTAAGIRQQPNGAIPMPPASSAASPGAMSPAAPPGQGTNDSTAAGTEQVDASNQGTVQSLDDGGDVAAVDPTNPSPDEPQAVPEASAVPDEPQAPAPTPGGGGPMQGEPGVISEPTTNEPTTGEPTTNDPMNTQPGATMDMPPGAAGQALQDTGQALTAGTVPGMVAFLKGGGAAPPQVVKQAEAQVDPTGQMPQDEKVIQTIASQPTPEKQFGVMQYYRQQYDGMKASAAAGLNQGDLEHATQMATKAYSYLPDGYNINFTPSQSGKVGITATVRSVADPSKGVQYNLSPEQFNQFLRGPDGQYDMLMEHDVNATLSKMSTPTALTSFNGLEPPGTPGAPAWAQPSASDIQKSKEAQNQQPSHMTYSNGKFSGGDQQQAQSSPQGFHSDPSVSNVTVTRPSKNGPGFNSTTSQVPIEGGNAQAPLYGTKEWQDARDNALWGGLAQRYDEGDVRTAAAMFPYASLSTRDLQKAVNWLETNKQAGRKLDIESTRATSPFGVANIRATQSGQNADKRLTGVQYTADQRRGGNTDNINAANQRASGSDAAKILNGMLASNPDLSRDPDQLIQAAGRIIAKTPGLNMTPRDLVNQAINPSQNQSQNQSQDQDASPARGGRQLGNSAQVPSNIPPPQQRLPGKVYMTPKKGPQMWTGTGWVTPQGQ